MGEPTPTTRVLTCPGCDTQFRLRANGGRLPDGPVDCPKCAAKIPVIPPDELREHPLAGGEQSPSAGDSAEFIRDPADELPAAPSLDDQAPAQGPNVFGDNASPDVRRQTNDSEAVDAPLASVEPLESPTQPQLAAPNARPEPASESGGGVENDSDRPALDDAPSQLVDQDNLGTLHALQDPLAGLADELQFDDSPVTTGGRFRTIPGFGQFGDQEPLVAVDFYGQTDGDSRPVPAARPEARQTKQNSIPSAADQSSADDGLEQDPSIGDDERLSPALPDDEARFEASEDAERRFQNVQDELDDEASSNDVLEVTSPLIDPEELRREELRKRLATGLARQKSREQELPADPATPTPHAADPSPFGHLGLDRAPAFFDPSDDFLDDDSEILDPEADFFEDDLRADLEGSAPPESPSTGDGQRLDPSPADFVSSSSKASDDAPDEQDDAADEQVETDESEPTDARTADTATTSTHSAPSPEANPTPDDLQTKESLAQLLTRARKKSAERPGIFRQVKTPDPARENRASSDLVAATPGAADPDDPNKGQPPGGDESPRRHTTRGGWSGDSGQIRLPTAEIEDALGDGEYKIWVGDTIYGPVGRSGLTNLVKNGLLFCSAELAESDGEWLPVQEHPVFHVLRRKMRREAERLLASFEHHPAERNRDEVTAELPLFQRELTENRQPRPTPSPPPIPTGTSTPKINLLSDKLPSQDSPEEDWFHLPGSRANIPLQEHADTAATEGSFDYWREPASQAKFRPLVVLLTVMTGIALLAAIAFSPIGRPYLEDYIGPVGANVPPSQKPATRSWFGGDDRASAAQESAQAARTAVHDAARVPLGNREDLSAKASSLIEQGDARAASILFDALDQRLPAQTDLAVSYIDALIEEGDFSRARRILIEAYASGVALPDLKARFRRATTSDPRLGDYSPSSLDELGPVDQLRPYRRWRQPHLQVVRGSEVTGVLQPALKNRPASWRDDLAAWRLCELMACHFRIPDTRVVVLERRKVLDLVPDDLAQDETQRVLDQFDWQQRDGSDDQTTLASLTRWPGEPAGFPIELIDGWRPWLRATEPESILDRPATDAVEPFARYMPADSMTALRRHLRGTNTAQLSRALSSMLVFDYLTNHWDRFERTEARYGSNISVFDGQLYSLNNAGAFRPRASTRVRGRFNWVSRFSDSTLASLELLEPDFVSDALYPEPSELDDAKLAVFWEQRDRALRRVETLVDLRDPSAVLAFD